MASYNLVNGVAASENPWLLHDILREEWGWDGLVVSDWFFSVKSTAASVNAGLDLEMPGPPIWRGEKLLAGGPERRGAGEQAGRERAPLAAAAGARREVRAPAGSAGAGHRPARAPGADPRGRRRGHGAAQERAAGCCRWSARR